MPFLKFSRDKRGYEHTYLMHAVARRGKPARTRILYWYRTPPGVRVGRLPFDDEVRRTIEARNPGVVFDWDALASTPIPPPDNTEHWRERRRLEKAAKQARRQEEAEEAIESADPLESEPGPEREPSIESGEGDAEVALAEAPDPSVQATQRATPPGGARRRRRRGGRRRGAGAASENGASASTESTGPEPAPSDAPDSSSEGE